MSRPHDRHIRRRPFSKLMKRFAGLKNSSSEASTTEASATTAFPLHNGSKAKKTIPLKNNPYPESGKHLAQAGVSHDHRSDSYASPAPSKQSLSESAFGQQPGARASKSAAPTVSTNPETIHSDTAQSKSGTATTGLGAISSHGIGGEGSTFSSPAPSERSMTTTLTTVQSTAPAHAMAGAGGPNAHGGPASATAAQAITFSHQFPATSPASAIPSHIAGPITSGGHPATYNTATANNLLTDNASILTLASSSKRRRRNSLDTNASVRALAPSSVFGGSRESLPLSVLNSADQASLSTHHSRAVAAATAASNSLPMNERASVYSSSGIAPALTSERNSYYAAKQTTSGGGGSGVAGGVGSGDGASVRSGFVGHGRNDSITGSIGGIAAPTSPLASPREVSMVEKLSRRNSGWGEVEETEGEDDGIHEGDGTGDGKGGKVA